MKILSKTMAFLLASAILYVLSGCNSMQRFGAPSEITIEIEPIKCKAENLHCTKPIEIKTFSDNRKDELKGFIGFYNMPLWSDRCRLPNFEGIVTEVFKGSISNAQVVEQSETQKLVLSGEIEDFFVYWGRGALDQTVGYNPLRIKLTIVSEYNQSVWSKTVEGKIEGSLYLQGLFSMTAEDHMKGTVKKCVLNAVKELLKDESFWDAVSP